MDRSAQQIASFRAASTAHGSPLSKKALRRIKSLQKRGDFNESRIFCEKLIKQGCADSNLLFLHGWSLRGCGQLDAAAKRLEQAHELDPTNATIVNSLGILCLDMGKSETAIDLFKLATKIDQNDIQSWINLGKTLRTKDRFEAAELAFTCAHNIDPSNPEPLLQLADILVDSGGLESARNFIESRVADPGKTSPQLKLKLLQIAARQQDFIFVSEYYASFDRRELSVDDRALLDNVLAFSLEMQEKYEDAIAVLEGWVEKPNSHQSQLRSQLGILYSKAGDNEKAIGLHKNILKDDPEHIATRYNLSLLQFRVGDLAGAYSNHEARWQWREFPSKRRKFDQPQWSGEPITGKKILIWREQGLGDEVRFASLLPELAKHGCEITLECMPKLSELFKGSFPSVTVKHEGATECRGDCNYSQFDYQIPIGTLGAHFRPDIGSFEKQQPWLKRDNEREAQVRSQVGVKNGELLVGLCWRSSNQVTSRNRYFFDISQLKPLKNLSSVKFLNVQYDALDREITLGRDVGLPLYHYPDVDQKDDIVSACVMLGACDLVITIGGAVGDLAGGLGVPMIYITRENSEIFLGTDHVPWFPSAKSYPIKPYGGDTVVSKILDTWPNTLKWLEAMPDRTNRSYVPSDTGTGQDFDIAGQIPVSQTSDISDAGSAAA